MRNDSISNASTLQISLRSALGPGFQFSGPGDALLRAASRRSTTVSVDPMQRNP